MWLVGEFLSLFEPNVTFLAVNRAFDSTLLAAFGLLTRHFRTSPGFLILTRHYGPPPGLLTRHSGPPVQVLYAAAWLVGEFSALLEPKAHEDVMAALLSPKVTPLPQTYTPNPNPQTQLQPPTLNPTPHTRTPNPQPPNLKSST